MNTVIFQTPTLLILSLFTFIPKLNNISRSTNFLSPLLHLEVITEHSYIALKKLEFTRSVYTHRGTVHYPPQGDIYVNGIPLSKMRDWFIMNTGYVRQLATSFYNELTVRENLLFSMNMQAPSGMTLAQKLERVEQVIRETGLQEQADLVVGSGIGLGLSGGQVC